VSALCGKAQDPLKHHWKAPQKKDTVALIPARNIPPQLSEANMADRAGAFELLLCERPEQVSMP
jgi:hypothetical protein